MRKRESLEMWLLPEIWLRLTGELSSDLVSKQIRNRSEECLDLIRHAKTVCRARNSWPHHPLPSSATPFVGSSARPGPRRSTLHLRQGRPQLLVLLLRLARLLITSKALKSHHRKLSHASEAPCETAYAADSTALDRAGASPQFQDQNVECRATGVEFCFLSSPICARSSWFSIWHAMAILRTRSGPE